MLTSFLINNPGHHSYYLLDHSLSNESIQKIHECLKNYDVDIIRLKIDFGQHEGKLRTTNNWTIDTYSTLLIQDIIPHDVDRILYLDADTIVNASIEELYYIDFEENCIVATDDSNGKNTISDYSDIQIEMMQNNISSYFNTGTMLMNLELIRKNNSFETYMKVMEKWNYNMTALEQDVLNHSYIGLVKKVPWEKYNLFARFAHNDGWNYNQVLNETSIVHFAGVKPWQNLSFHYDIEKLWWDYAAKTPIFNKITGAFISDMCTNHLVEDQIRNLIHENQEQKQLINKMYNLLSQMNK